MTNIEILKHELKRLKESLTLLDAEDSAHIFKQARINTLEHLISIKEREENNDD